MVGKPARRPDGFTLIELMVAMTVFAVIASAAYAGLDSAIMTEARLDEEGREWKELSLFFARLERDLSCFVDRQVTGPNGEKLRSMEANVLDSSGGMVELAFTRLGGSEEGGVPKRVGYRLKDGGIEALIWPALDAAPEAKPDVYTAVEGVSAFDIRLGGGGGWVKQWTDKDAPKAVEAIVTLATGEKIRRAFALR